MSVLERARSADLFAGVKSSERCDFADFMASSFFFFNAIFGTCSGCKCALCTMRKPIFSANLAKNWHH